MPQAEIDPTLWWMPCSQCRTPNFIDQWMIAGADLDDAEAGTFPENTALCPNCGHYQTMQWRDSGWPTELRAMIEFSERYYLADAITQSQFHAFARIDA